MTTNDAAALAAQILLASAIDAAREQGSPRRAVQLLKQALTYIERIQFVLALPVNPGRDRVLPLDRSEATTSS